MSPDMSVTDQFSDAPLPPGISSVLAVLLSSAVVLDSHDRVLSSSTAAREFGFVEDGRLVVGELLALARQVRREGLPREGEIDIMTNKFNGRATSFAVRVAPLGPAVGDGGLILLLAEDQTESRRVEEVRRDFVANVSHELKTPIGALGLLAETIVSADDVEVVRRLAEQLVRESDRLGSIVDDLLDLSLIEAQAAPTREPTPVHVLVEEAVERLGPLALAGGIPLRTEPIAAELVVSCDPAQLVSAITNLLDNAVKYSEQGQEVEVSVSAEGGQIVLCVCDHGIGIPSKDLERVFERFYRVDKARSRATGGTGLGLSIVRHVAEAHGGEVTVESTEGEGSTFRLAVPLVDAASPVAEAS